MSVSNRILNLLFKMPKPTNPNPTVERDVKILMPDGAVLLADLYRPRQGSNYPTVLIRTPYGRHGLLPTLFPLPFAENGYNVLYQSTRGTAGSGGDFVYARDEHADGLATIEWIKKQDWFNGQLVTAGASYLGFVQWAVAAFAGPELKAIAPFVTTSDFNTFRFQGGTVTLETMLAWSTQMTEFAKTGQKLSDLLKQGKRRKVLDKAYNHLPLKEADREVVGKPSQTFQDVLAHGIEDEYWKPVDYSDSVKDVTVPVSLAAGWYDLFLYWQLQDYRRLREAGKQPYLLIGPWFHGQPSSFSVVAKENLDWFDAHVKGKTEVLRKDPVRLFVMGANKWRDFADWPPSSRSEKWYLQPEGGLSTETPPPSEPDRYRYNPADPTPAVGGNSLGVYMGPKDNRELEARSDVLVYSSAPLKKDLEVIGPVKAELYVRSSLEYTDFFARLCVVEKSGKSVNLCDGIIRLEPGSKQATPQEDGSLCVNLELWPTANRFKRGQRVRLQVSSGAHPRFPRNPGSGEPLGEETTLKLADQTIYHDPAHPSAVILPVVDA
ncbi:MAG: CocE/NonD family hydrolase [Chloroflexi bacterium]|nr:CocE/NonD family hydrolase [Chloroflexota bacterium]